MKNIFKIAAICFLALLTSCYQNNRTTSTHIISNDKYKVPKREGKACASYPFTGDIFGTRMNDISVETARKNGNISEISTIEEESRGSLFSHEICTVVRGN